MLIDFFVIRAVFSVVDNFFQAGDLGIALFSTLNNLEVIVATGILALVCWQYRQGRKVLPHLLMALCLWIIAMVYFTFLTPKLVALTELWKRTDLMGLTAVAGIPDVQQEHQFYHLLYRSLDTVKLGFLLALMSFGIWSEERWSA